MLIRDGLAVYEAIYQKSYRHAARRLAGTLATNGLSWSFRSETEAVDALERQADLDGVRIGIQAGSYHPGTRRLGDVIA